MIIELTKPLMKKILETEYDWKFGTKDTFLFNESQYTLSKERMNPPGKKFRLICDSKNFENTYQNMATALLDMVNQYGKTYKSLHEYLNEQ